MRSFKGPCGSPVALAADVQDVAEFVLDLSRCLDRKRLFQHAFERKHGIREGRVRSARLARQLDQRR